MDTDTGTTRRPVSFLGGALPAVLLALLLAVNGLAIWGIVSARDEAERTALQELVLETQADARAVEAALATLRGDFIFLSYAPPLARAPAALSGEDPVSRRWSRLAVEAALILFLEAHPTVELLTVEDAAGEAVAAVGWRQGMPVLVSPGSSRRGPPASAWRTSWPLAAEPGAAEIGGRIVAWLDPHALVAAAVPGPGERLRLETTPEPLTPGGPAAGTVAEPTGRRTEDRFVVRAPVTDPRWQPPIRWQLVRTEEEGRLLGSVQALAGSYRTTVVANLAVITLSLGLGALAFREALRAARASAESRHQARLVELERQVRHSERLASIGRLTAGMAHEINNPLEGMINYLGMLDEDLEAGDTDSARHLAGRLREGLDRVAGIVGQALRFGEPGRAPREPVAVAELLEQALGFVAANPVSREIDLRLEIDGAVEGEEGAPGSALTVFGNRTTLGQLVLNLLLNACEAQRGNGGGPGTSGDGGGSVTVRAGLAEAPGETADGGARRVHIVVEDRGPGLAREVRDHLFEPFFSTRGSTGLGLSVVHGIVAEHGGTVTAENRPGGGARFVVELPAAAPGATEPPPRPEGSRAS